MRPICIPTKKIACISCQGGFLFIRKPNSDSLSRNFFGRNRLAREVPKQLSRHSKHNPKGAGKKGPVCKRTLMPLNPWLLLHSQDNKPGNPGKPSEK
jgi:hypothetical protein